MLDDRPLRAKRSGGRECFFFLIEVCEQSEPVYLLLKGRKKQKSRIHENLEFTYFFLSLTPFLEKKKYHPTSGLRRVSTNGRNSGVVCKTELFKPCYTFFLQEKKPENLFVGSVKFSRQSITTKGSQNVRRTRGSPDSLFLFSNV